MLESGKRIHGLDALRALAMLLGVFLHSAIAYKVKPHRNWLHDNEFNSWIFDYLYFIIHSFRMPLFFLIAGFFARLLYYKIGEKEFIFHRWKRVGLPFILSMIFILPLSIIPHHFYIFFYKEGLPYTLALKKSVLRIFGYNGLAHLWFLYDLIIFYVCLIIVIKIRKSTFLGKYLSRISRYYSDTDFKKWYWILIVSLPVWVCLIPEKGLFMLTDTSILPKRINNLFLYGYLFWLGWILNKRTDVFLYLSNQYKPFLVLASILGSLLFYYEWKILESGTQLLNVVVHFGAALQITLFVFGLIGLFLSVFKFKNDTWKYISDASYWIYLIHLSIVTTMQIVLLNSVIPGVLKFPIVLSVSIIISLLTYQLFIRYTFIGRILHGARIRK